MDEVICDEVICSECGVEFNRLFWGKCPDCSGTNNASIVLQPVHLGTGQKGVQRRKALEALAAAAECFWNNKPSIGRWLTWMADNYKER